MERVIEKKIEATIETLELIGRLFNLLQEKGETNQLVNFLSQIEIKAKKRKKKYIERQSRGNIGTTNGDHQSPEYWEGIHETVKLVKNRYLQYQTNIPGYIEKLKVEVINQQKYTQSSGIKDFSITSLMLNGGKISVLGLDRAGKTSLLQRLKLGKWKSDTSPTIGMNAETFYINGIKFTAWDLGGQIQFRNALWKTYTKNSVGLIFVIDIKDRMRRPEVRATLQKILEYRHLDKIPLAIFANKIDLIKEEMTVNDLKNILGIKKIADRKVKILKTSAKTGEGIVDGVYWLTDTILMEKGKKKRDEEDAATPFIYSSSYPRKPPNASAEGIPKIITNSIHHKNKHRIIAR